MKSGVIVTVRCAPATFCTTKVWGCSRVVREQARIQRIDHGLSIAVDGVLAIHLNNLVAAEQDAFGGRRVLDVGHHDIARRRGREDFEKGAVAGHFLALRQRLPLVRVVGEVKLVLGLTRGRGGVGLQQVEIGGRGVGRRIRVRDFAEPEVGVVRPRAQPVVLIRARSRHVGGARPRGYAHLVEIRSRQEGARAAAAATAAPPPALLPFQSGAWPTSSTWKGSSLPHADSAANRGNSKTLNLEWLFTWQSLNASFFEYQWSAICTLLSKQQSVAAKLRSKSRSMMVTVMNRLLRPFGLKLGPLQAGAIYFPLHFLAVGIGLTALIAPQGVGVFWPAAGSLFAFLLLYPARYWGALFITSLRRRAAGQHSVRTATALFGRGDAVSREVRGGAARRRNHASRGARTDFLRAPASRAHLYRGGTGVNAVVRHRRNCVARRPGFRRTRVLAGGAELVDRRFPGRTHHHPPGTDRGLSRLCARSQRARRTRRNAVRFRRVAGDVARGVPAQARRTLFAVGRALHRLSSAGVDRDAEWPATHRAGRGHHRRHCVDCHHARVRTVRQPVPAADFSGAVRVARAAAAGGDGRARLRDREGAHQRRALSRLHRQQFRGDFPLRACRAHAGHDVARRTDCLGAQTRPRRRVQYRVHGRARRQGCAGPGGRHASR